MAKEYIEAINAYRVPQILSSFARVLMVEREHCLYQTYMDFSAFLQTLQLPIELESVCEEKISECMDTYKRKMLQLTRLEYAEDVLEVIEDLEFVRKGLKKQYEDYHAKNNELLDINNREIIKKVKQDAMQE